MAFIGLVAPLLAGWFFLSGWWSIPIGLLSFFGAHRALPEAATRINNMGWIGYIIVSFLLMKLAGWVHGLVL